jgi:hypothetical protein
MEEPPVIKDASPNEPSSQQICHICKKMNANILYSATCKIAREQHHGPEFVDYHRVMNEEQNFHRGN